MTKLLCKWLGHKKGYIVTVDLNDFRKICYGFETPEKSKSYYCKRCGVDLPRLIKDK